MSGGHPPISGAGTHDFDLSLFALSGVDIPSGPLKLVGNGAVDLG